MNNNLPWNEWFQKASQVKTTNDFTKLFNELFCNYEHTYDSAVHAVSTLALAGANLGAHVEGITGFQAGFVKFDFIRQWDRIGKDVGIHIVDYDKLCYPQHVVDFPIKRISLDTWKSVQKACQRKLNKLDTYDIIKHDINGDFLSYNHACWEVRQYWADVCNGDIPDELIVVDDNGICYGHINPVCVTRPAHTIRDLEEAWQDHTSPYFDKERYKKYIDEKYNTKQG